MDNYMMEFFLNSHFFFFQEFPQLIFYHKNISRDQGPYFHMHHNHIHDKFIHINVSNIPNILNIFIYMKNSVHIVLQFIFFHSDNSK